MRFIRMFALGLLLLVSASFSSAQTFTTIDFPGAGRTFPGGINNLGDVIGFYVDADGIGYHAFLLSGGTYTPIDIGTTATLAGGINDSGEIVGQYYDPSGVEHGFLLQGQNVTTLDYPGAARTYPSAINNSGVIVGYYYESVMGFHGFIYNAGTWTAVDVPGAWLTQVFGINDLGDIAGWYNTGTGFVISQGQLKVLKDGQLDVYQVTGINNHRQVIGTVRGNGTQSNRNQAVIYSGGTFIKLKNLSTLDPPYMTGGAVNDNGAAVGAYQDAQFVVHGYLRTPN
jgi:probable HAF family extracellular repeat protein